MEAIKLITNNISTSSFFIAVNINCDNEIFPIVIGNNSLFNMMRRREMIRSPEEYSDKIFTSIIKKEPIRFDAKDKEVLKDYYVAQDDTLRKSLRKNREAFINNYFIDNMLKSRDISFAQEKTIIYYLFIDGIYCNRDDITGSIFIREPEPLPDPPPSPPSV